MNFIESSTAIVGDVHGDVRALSSALDALSERPGTVIFVGDYVNRGPDSRGVLDLLSAFTADRPDTVLLRGNHEGVLLEFLRSGDATAFIRHGGLATVRSYVGPHPPPDVFNIFRGTFPVSHLKLLHSTSIFVETDAVLVSHAGLNPDDPKSRSEADMVYGSFPELFHSDLSEHKPLIVCGHYVQGSGEAYASPGFVCLDSGCGSRPAGRLSVLHLPEMTIQTYAG